MSAGLIAGPILSMVDTSVVNVAVPDLIRELGQPLGTVQWAISGYLLALAVGLAATSFLARRFGLLPAYIASLALFTLASLACALAPDIGSLIAFRAVQGLCGAPMVPLAIGLLIGQGGAAEAGRTRMPIGAALAFFAAPSLGVSLGGLLISLEGWRVIFLVLSLLGGLTPERVPDGNTLFSVAQRLAGSFGIALLATFFTARGAATGSALTGLHESVLLLAAVALTGALAAAWLRTTPDHTPLPAT